MLKPFHHPSSPATTIHHPLSFLPPIPHKLQPPPHKLHLLSYNALTTPRPIKAVVAEPPQIGTAPENAPHLTLTAIVTIKRKGHRNFNDTMMDSIDALSDSAGQNITLQLVSNEVDRRTGVGRRSQESTLKDWVEKAILRADKVEYTAEFVVSRDFGQPGAIIIVNRHQTEFYVETIFIQGLNTGKVYFPCYSWVHAKKDNLDPRVFFTNQVYLPSATPSGLKDLRQLEMVSLRGTGKGDRKFHDRIYDYALYNDLGNPDKDKKLARKTLGASKEVPYPRRCRTGRSSTVKDPSAESVLRKGINNYVPRDETFEEIKQDIFVAGSLKVIVHQLLPVLINQLRKGNDEFHCFTDIDRLYREGMILEPFDFPNDLLKNFAIPNPVKKFQETVNLQYSQPQLFTRDKFAWLRDDEFGRQVLAGVNPLQIERLEAFPPVSKLDPNVYGPREAAFRVEHIERHLCGLTVEKAIEQEKLFILDYHDAFLPFVNKVNALNGRKMYASRTILYLNSIGTLMPIAIELCLPPPSPGVPGSQRVFTPGQDASTYWFWQLAKAHVSGNDAGFHQLVNHWLRTHAATEPYIIAAHRQLSVMHPISKLLLPHLRYTMEINAAARQLLINADGVIEKCFTPGPYSMEMSASAYRALWRFDKEGLPADLKRRGMAVEDSSKPYGLRLVVEDYPYATDGLLIWSVIQSWVDEYVSLYYSDPHVLAEDVEIHRWWEEIRYEGHADKKDETWWPELQTKEDLAGVLTTIIWVASAHHAAVNFGQYTYAGYIPNHPCITRRLIPEPKEDNREYQAFIDDPHKFFLSTIANRLQATVVMAVLDNLSTHSPDEEYLGHRVHTNWTADAKAKAAAARFAEKLEEAEKIIVSRNKDLKLKNRSGAGVLPYELLRPTSKQGVTGRGIPNSISI